MKPVNEQDNHDKGNKGVFESKGKRVEGAGKNCAGRKSHSSRDLVVAEPSEKALEGCHKPPGGRATRRPRPAGPLPGPLEARRARVFVSLALCSLSDPPVLFPP